MTKMVKALRTTEDRVNHPSHYTSGPHHPYCDEPIECIDITRGMNFCRGNAVKYIWRAGLKDRDREIEDLQKAVFYLEDEVNRLQKDV